MTTARFDSLRNTLQRLRRRRRNLYLLRQGSFHSIALVLVILISSLIGLWLQPARLATTILFVLTLACMVAVIGNLIRTLSRRHADERMLAHYVEDRIPDLEQRLLTSLEFSARDLEQRRDGVSTQFIQQLWKDAQQQVQKQQKLVRTVEPASRSWIAFASALSVLAAVAVLFLGSDSLLRAGSRLAWPFAISDPQRVVGVGPLAAPIEIGVEPGDIRIQRGESLTIIARVSNATPETVKLRLQDDRVNWRDAAMQRDGAGTDSAAFSYFIPALQQDTSYYISFSEGGEYSSQQYRISLYDLPQVEQLDLTFDYPDYTGIKDNVETDSGDMMVPEGTVVSLDVMFNKAIEQARVEFDKNFRVEEDGEVPGWPPYADLPLAVDGLKGTTRFTVNQDGIYRILATDYSGLQSQNPVDYYIRAIKDSSPELALQRPGRDQEVMPLEEVVIEVEARDDYGLSEFTLNYSVVGSDPLNVDFLPESNVRQVTGRELIYLEELEVEPGDFVSYFLTLADNNALRGRSEVISDIFFLQIIPTAQEFRRSSGTGSSQGGAGGRGSGDSSALVAVQKDIIAATWKLRNRQNKASAGDVATDAGIVAAAQREATGRARRSIDRLAERLNFSDDTYATAVENLSLAIEQMNLAADELELSQVASALLPEQRALQLVLKAEASINRTNISMQQQGSGGGGARQEREDLRELFEMELGQLENRYENPDTGDGLRENQQQVDKLQELARRQESLTRAQRNLARRQEQLSENQKRRELERLTRQQEQLSREVAQLARQMSQGQQSPSQSQSGSSATAGSSEEQAQQTTLQRAARQMQQAAESISPSVAAARSQKALENLRQQQRELAEQGNSSVRQLAQSLDQRGQRLLQRQRDLMRDIAETSHRQGLGQTRQAMSEDASLQVLIEAQQRQQTEVEEIEDMLRAVIARSGNEEQRLLTQARSASDEIRPIQESMRTSGRVLRNGMVNLAVDIEQEIEQRMEQLARSLAALQPSRNQNASNPIQLAANDAETLREQIENLRQQALAFNQAQQQAGYDAPSLGEMREQLKQSGQLAQRLQQQVQRPEIGPSLPAGQSRSRQEDPAQQMVQQPGNRGRAETDGGNLPWGYARSIRQQLIRQDIEDFLNQPELFQQLLHPINELAGALRAQAELVAINNRLSATETGEIPEQYRELVEQYYRVLSESQGSIRSTQQ